MTKITGSGSISQRHGSADPDPDPDPHQNVMDRNTAEEEGRCCGAGAEITNRGSGSFLFTTDLNKFYRTKSRLPKNFVVNFYNNNPTTSVKKRPFSKYLVGSDCKRKNLPVFRIRDVLIRIRIHGFRTLDYGSGSCSLW
jgi:hypothetical protein